MIYRRVTILKPSSGPAAGPLTELAAVREARHVHETHDGVDIPGLVIMATVRGSARFASSVGSGVERRGSLSIVGEGVHQTRPQILEPWHIEYLILHGPWSEQIRATLWPEGSGGLQVLDPGPRRLIRDLHDAVDLALDQPSNWEWRFMSQLAAIGDQLIRVMAAQEASLAQRVRQCVEAEPDRHWSLAELAELLSVSPSTLSHQFAMEKGEPPMAWVRRARVQIARRYLEQGLSVCDTAERMGFANPYHFSRVFKQVAGITPSHVRVQYDSPLLDD